MWHNKSNIPITVLVIGIILVCGLALVSFFLSKGDVKKGFVGVYLTEKLNSQVENYIVHGSLVGSNTRFNDKGELVFYQEYKEKGGFLFLGKEKVVFSIEHPISS